MTTKKTWSRWLWTLSLPLVALSACGGGSDDDLDDRLGLANPKTRFVHAVPLGPSLTVSRNGAEDGTARDAGYGFASHYAHVETGATALSVKTTTGDLTVGEQRFDAERGHKYTLVALPGSDLIELLLIDDPFRRSLLTDDARLRVLNASFNAQDLDVYLTAPEERSLQGRDPLFASVKYKESRPASGENSQTVEEGSYRLHLTRAGTQDVVFTTRLELGKNADWLLTTLPSDGLEALLPNRVRVLVVQSDDDRSATEELASDD